MVADDLDGVLICTDGAVAAETPELALDGAFCCSVRAVAVFGKGEVGDVVHDADGELMLGLILLELVVNSEDGCGGRILRAQTVASADDGCLHAGVCQSGDNVHVEGLTQGAGLLGAVEDSNLLGGCRDGCDQLVGTERTIQADLDDTDLLTVGVHVVDDFFCHVADGAHGDDDAVCIGRAIVVEQLIVGAELFVDLAHILLNDCGQLIVELVAGFTMLEEDIAVFVRAAHCRMLGVQRVLAERRNSVHVAHFLEVRIIPHSDLLDLVGGTEAIEEVQERNLAFDCSQMGNGRKVHDFLRVGLAHHGEAGLAASHNVGVITEDVQSVRRDGTCRNVEHAGQLLSGDLVHVGDHQKKTLGCGVGGGQSAGAEGAVNCTGCTGFGLHFDDLDGGAEDVLQTGCRPLVDKVCHGGRRGDGVNARDFSKRIGYMSRSIVAVHGFKFTSQFNYLLKVIT